jgi:hypothetical protein
MGDEATTQSDQAPLAPLVGLVDRLRAEVMEMEGRWEALGEELEAKRRKLRLAEATVGGAHAAAAGGGHTRGGTRRRG